MDVDAKLAEFEPLVDIALRRAGVSLSSSYVDDLRQAARIGLWRGIRTWRPDGGATLGGFAFFRAVCAVRDERRRIDPAARRRSKRSPIALSLDALREEPAAPVEIDDEPEPREALEQRILRMRRRGATFSWIAARLGIARSRAWRLWRRAMRRAGRP